jgi:hypothetical protein
MSGIVTVVLMYHCHKPTDLINAVAPIVTSSSFRKLKSLIFMKLKDQFSFRVCKSKLHYACLILS